MSSYFVIGMRKIKTAEEFKNKIVGHNNRERTYKDKHFNINPERTPYNLNLTELQFRSEAEIRKYAKKHLKKGKRQLQKNKAFAFEIVVDCSVIPGWKSHDYTEYLIEAEKWFKKRFEGQKVVSSVIHVDEGKPHLHLTFLYFNEELGQWNQKNLYKNGLTDMNKILDEFERDIGVKYGFERGKGQDLDKVLDNTKKHKLKSGKEVYLANDIKMALRKQKKALSQLNDLKFYKNKADLEREVNEIANHQLEEKMKENRLIEAENVDLKQKNNELQKINEQLEVKYRETQNKLNELEREKREIESKSNDLQREKRFLEMNIEQRAEKLLEQRIEPYITQINELKFTIKNKDKQIEEQEEEISSYKTKFQELQQEFKEYKQMVWDNVVEPIKNTLSEISFTAIRRKITELYEYKIDKENQNEYGLMR